MVFLNMLVLWSNTIINIPVHDNLDNYKELPVANLYIDGEIVYDDEMYYQYEVDRTFFSVINTSNLGSYQVKYRVFFPSFDQVHTHTIYFNVVDNTPPEITYLPTFNIPVGSKNIDLTKGIKLIDNYDEESNLVITIINIHQINLNVVGMQPIIYEVKDSSNNIREYTHQINVYDNIPPVIKQNHIVEIILGQTINYRSFFSVNDNYDNVLVVEFDDSLINYNKTGSYPARISATDQSGNKSTYDFNVLVKDVLPPVIKLKQKMVSLPLNFNLTNDYLLSLILSIDDDHDELTIFDVNIKNFVVSETVGTYDIIYSCFDSSNNKTEEVLKVNIIDNEPPNLIIINELKIEVGSLYINFDDYFKLTDNWDNNPTYKISSNYNLNKLGSYLITIDATDNSRNNKIYYMILEVVDCQPPTIQIKNEKIKIGNISELSKNLIIEDNYDDNNKIKVDYDFYNINFFSPGDYEVLVTATDSSGNKTSLNFPFEITDNVPPEITLITKKVTLSYHDKNFEYEKIKYSVLDNYTLQSDIKISFENNIKFGIVGNYQIFLIATDQSGNESIKKIPVIIADMIPPYINNLDELVYQKPISIENILKDISITDEYSDNVLIEYPRNLSIDKPGIYQIPIIISDEYGNSDEVYLKIKILKQPIYQDKLIILSIIVLIVLISSLIIIYYKKRDGTSFDNL